MTLLTADHVYARELDREAAAGRIAATEAAEHPDRDALTSFLGMPDLDQVECNLQPVPLHPSDRVLLCSDGLYRNLSEAELAEELARPDPQAAAEALLGRALARPQPRQDNLTAVILALGGAGEAMPRSARRRQGWWIGLGVGLLLASAGGAALWWWERQRSEAPAPAIASPPPAPAAPATPPASETPPPTPSPVPAPVQPAIRT
ncbi:MAG: hypothetical protein H6R48_446 [Proteobacteria bacterium]|nr:hypothetical protein [Pseudomonadota bacterium]